MHIYELYQIKDILARKIVIKSYIVKISIIRKSVLL